MHGAIKLGGEGDELKGRISDEFEVKGEVRVCMRKKVCINSTMPCQVSTKLPRMTETPQHVHQEYAMLEQRGEI